MSRMKSILTLLIVLGLAGGGFAAWWFWNGKKDEIRLAGVVETQEVRLGSKIGGRVEKLLVAEGDTIKKDQVLVVLAIPELLAQREQTKAKVAVAKAARDRANNGYLPEEKAAAQGAFDASKARYERLVAGWRLQEQKQVRAELDVAEADLLQANAEFDRVKKLLYSNPGATSQKELDDAKRARDRAQAQVNSAMAKVEMVTKEGSRKEDIAEAAGDMLRTKAQLDLINRGIREEDKASAEAEYLAQQAKLTELEANIAEAEIKSPGNARVEVISIRPGDLVLPNIPVIRILKTDDCWVKVFVPETKLGRVTKGQMASVTIDSFPGRKFQGKVTQVASISEFLPRNVQSLDERRNQMFGIKITMTQPEAIDIFKPGMAAEVVLE
ncbi:MAG TPA: efflux RND transporter periplasmic adaptor subunit [Gemmatales bacterium]|nr:efflux RND transporter periplasmic adaptor subunit [Gemmatales bacterium]